MHLTLRRNLIRFDKFDLHAQRVQQRRQIGQHGLPVGGGFRLIDNQAQLAHHRQVICVVTSSRCSRINATDTTN